MAYIPMLPAATVAHATLDVTQVNTKLRPTLAELGFAIVTNVMTSAEAAHCENLFGQDLQSIIVGGTAVSGSPSPSPGAALSTPTRSPASWGGSPLVRAWPLERYPLGRIESSFASDYGIPHGRLAWQCRQHPNVQRVFQVLFNAATLDELCVGLDVVFFNNDFKSAALAEQGKQDGLWPHADHSTHVPVSGQWANYQSILYLWPADATTSATVVWPRSHQAIFPSIMQQKSEHLVHYTALPQHLMQQFVEGCGRVPVPAGGMVVWDSQTIHQGWSIGPRLAVPLAFEPRARRSEAVRQRKLRFMASGEPTPGRAALGLVQPAGSISDGGDAALQLQARAQLWTQDSLLLPTLRSML